MAMNQTEKAAMQTLRERVAFLEAQLPREWAVPVPLTRDEIEAEAGKRGNTLRVAAGWYWHEYEAERGGDPVTHGCSTISSHCDYDVARTTSQRMGRMYRTKLEALVAARIHAFTTFHKRLAALDVRIAEAQAETR
jgi:hypothetical protein